MRYAIIENNVVVNVEEHDPVTPPANAMASDTATIGDSWDGQGFVSPPPPAPTQTEIRRAILAQLAALDARTIRPLRSVLAAQALGQTPDPADISYLGDLRIEAEALRAQLSSPHP